MKSISHSIFNFYWPGRKRTEARVLMIVKKELMDKIIVENQMDLINHPYFLTLDIQEINSEVRPGKWTRVVNIYDNQVGQEHTWQNNTPRNQRAFKDLT